MIFDVYKKIAKSLEGSGLSKIPFVRSTHKKLVKSLAPDIVDFDIFRLKHLGSLDQENELFLKTLKDNLKVGDTAVDIGANIGYYTFYMSRFVGDLGGRIYAFEPEPTNFAVLKENRQLNDFKNVIIENLAVSDKSGFIHLELSEDTGQHRISEKGLKIKAITLDDYFQNQMVDFIKMDAEGHERKIFNGMRHILENPNLKMITEFYIKLLDDPSDYFDMLSQRFKLFDLRNDLKPASKQEIFKRYEKRATDLLCTY